MQSYCCCPSLPESEACDVCPERKIFIFRHKGMLHLLPPNELKDARIYKFEPLLNYPQEVKRTVEEFDKDGKLVKRTTYG